MAERGGEGCEGDGEWRGVRLQGAQHAACKLPSSPSSLESLTSDLSTPPPITPSLTGVVGLLGVHGLGDQELQVVADGALSHLGDVGCGWG